MTISGRAKFLASTLVVLLGGCVADPYDDDYYIVYDDAYTAYTYDDLAYEAMVYGYPYYYDYYYYYDPIYYYSGGEEAEEGAAPRDRAVPGPLGMLLSAFGTSVSAGCVTASGLTDEDGDGLASSYSAMLKCSSKDGSTVDGMVRITDADDTSDRAGFTVTFEGLKVHVRRPSGGSRGRSIDGTMTLSRVEAKGEGPPKYEVTRDMTVNFFDVRPDGRMVSGTYVTQGRSSYSPEPGLEGGDPLAAGTIEPSGTTKVTVKSAEGTTTRTITRSADPPLHWNRSCLEKSDAGAGFDAGTLVLRDDLGKEVRAAFSGCGAPSITKP